MLVLVSMLHLARTCPATQLVCDIRKKDLQQGVDEVSRPGAAVRRLLRPPSWRTELPPPAGNIAVSYVILIFYF